MGYKNICNGSKSLSYIKNKMEEEVEEGEEQENKNKFNIFKWNESKNEHKRNLCQSSSCAFQFMKTWIKEN